MTTPDPQSADRDPDVDTLVLRAWGVFLALLVGGVVAFLLPYGWSPSWWWIPMIGGAYALVILLRFRGGR